ncbi:hypothetical protein GJAV_G00232380 [Gymnothorax javanicus]|nr:hypothetical protein GJAV_G00232380 [Gymnothorax javanicus]
MTGASERSSTWFITASDTCAKSISIPKRFISFITCWRQGKMKKTSIRLPPHWLPNEGMKHQDWTGRGTLTPCLSQTVITSIAALPASQTRLYEVVLWFWLSGICLGRCSLFTDTVGFSEQRSG